MGLDIAYLVVGGIATWVGDISVGGGSETTAHWTDSFGQYLFVVDRCGQLYF